MDLQAIENIAIKHSGFGHGGERERDVHPFAARLAVDRKAEKIVQIGGTYVNV